VNGMGGMLSAAGTLVLVQPAVVADARSTERILTTHTGSLPRPDELTRAMFAKEEGVPVDSAPLPPDQGRGGRRGGPPGRRRPRRDRRRRVQQAELRDLREGPALRLRRREPSPHVSRTSWISRAWPAGCSATPPRADGRLPRARGRSRCATPPPR
jgi:hypothetical protein